MQPYIECDYITYEYTREFIEENKPQYTQTRHPRLNDYKTECNSGLWRDGSFGNALISLKAKRTDALHVYKAGKEILTITRETPKEAYVNA